MAPSHWTRFSAELESVFASVHMSGACVLDPAIPPGRAWSSNDPHLRQKETQIILLRPAQRDTFEEVADTEGEDAGGSDTTDPGDLQEYERDELEVLATCTDKAKMMLRFQVWTSPQLETACLKTFGTA